MKDYFKRQIACCEQALAEYQNLPDDLTGPDLEAARERQQRYARRWQDLADEFWVLKREWDAASGLSDADRAAVRELAGQAGPLVDRLAAMQAAAADLLGGRMRDPGPGPAPPQARARRPAKIPPRRRTQRPVHGSKSMNQRDDHMRALAEAFEKFTETTKTMDESYRRLETRVAALDRELADANRELALTSDYLESLLESMSDGVTAIDPSGRITAFNRAASAVLGYDRDEVVGQRFPDVFRREFALSPGRRATALRAKDGREIPVSEQDSPLSDRSGHRIGTVKVFQDLTEIEALREQVRQQDRLAAVGEMAATVAHEIRNPLGGIRGFAALLARDVDAEDPRKRLVNKIEVGAKELERVVSELLEYTRPVELPPAAHRLRRPRRRRTRLRRPRRQIHRHRQQAFAPTPA